MPAFIFTPDSFQLDPIYEGVAESDKRWRENFEQNKYQALFRLGFEARNPEFSQSMMFLHLLSERYLKVLTAHSELEIAREAIKVELPEAMSFS